MTYIELAFLVISNSLWAFIVWRREKLVSEMARLLASRTFSEYSIGEARLAGTRREQKPAEENYDSVWPRGDE